MAISGYMPNYEVRYLERLIASYEETENKNERAAFYQRINRFMVAHVYSPMGRAYSVFRSREI